jgi:hypothetical protein
MFLLHDNYYQIRITLFCLCHTELSCIFALQNIHSLAKLRYIFALQNSQTVFMVWYITSQVY